MNLTGTPQLEMELCRGFHFAPLLSDICGLFDESRHSPSIVYNLLLPLVTYYNFSLIQVVNRESFDLKDENEFEGYMKQRFEECKHSGGRTAIVIFVDELIGSSSTVIFSNSQIHAILYKTNALLFRSALVRPLKSVRLPRMNR